MLLHLLNHVYQKVAYDIALLFIYKLARLLNI